MTLTERIVDHVAVLDLAGQMTSTNGSGLLKEAVERLVDAGNKHIVLNLSQLSYMDSSGLGEMIACYTRASKVGGSVRLAHVTERIQDLLSITKLITVFDTFDTERLAVASFAPAAGASEPATAARA